MNMRTEEVLGYNHYVTCIISKASPTPVELPVWRSESAEAVERTILDSGPHLVKYFVSLNCVASLVSFINRI